VTDQSLNDKRMADRLKRDLQTADAPKAWAEYVAEIQRTRTRTASLRTARLAREAATPRASTPVASAPRKRKSRSS
jgi:hypothetical protein